MDKLIIKIIRENLHISYFYYPSISCKTKDGEIKMLMKTLKEINEPYKLEITQNK